MALDSVSVAKWKCAKCKKYFPAEGERGVSVYCSDECRYNRTPSLKKSRGSTISMSVREAIMKADENSCRGCGGGGLRDLQLHHITYRSEGGKDTGDNLITLCQGCHDMVHSNKLLFQPLCQQIVVMRESGDKRTTIGRLLYEVEKLSDPRG